MTRKIVVKIVASEKPIDTRLIAESVARKLLEGGTACRTK